MEKIIQNIFNNWLEDREEEFLGVFSVSNIDGAIFEHVSGYRNRAEELPNTTNTIFGIASGTKLFTGLAICKLIDEGKLSLEDKLCDLLNFDLGKIDKRITVYHLLTHTSGVGDYIDKEADDSEEQLQNLYNKYPAHLWTRLEYYLQMITPLKPKFEPGERYGYSNSGYVLLGLVIEAVSGIPYQQFINNTIISPYNLTHTEFYRMNALPTNTAVGYMQDEDTGEWHTNIFNLPILGGSDGGLYTCAEDLDKLWKAIFSHKILSEEMTNTFLKSHVVIDEEDGESYGLGVYRYENDEKLAYFAVGGDSGVGFFTAYYPKAGVVASAFSNTGWINGTYDLIAELLETLG